MNHDQSHALFSRAQQLLPGGVNSPVRAFKSVGGEPFFVERADGAYLYDVDGNRYIDYVGSWGPMIVGHNHPAVRQAVKKAIDNGLSFGAPCAAEVTMAETITRLVPSCEMVRMVNSGTEATLSAIRLARGATGRNRIVKFEGCYHGHGDSFLVKAGSGMLTLGVPTSPGVPAGLSELTLTLSYNDFDGAAALFEQYGGDVVVLGEQPLDVVEVVVAQQRHALARRALARGEGGFGGTDVAQDHLVEPAVEAGGHLGDARPAGVGARRAAGQVHRLAAGVGEDHLVERAAVARQAVGGGMLAHVGPGRRGGILQGGAHRLDHRRLGMAEQHRAEAQRGIDVAPPLGVPEIGPPAPLDEQLLAVQVGKNARGAGYVTHQMGHGLLLHRARHAGAS